MLSDDDPKPRPQIEHVRERGPPPGLAPPPPLVSVVGVALGAPFPGDADLTPAFPHPPLELVLELVEDVAAMEGAPADARTVPAVPQPSVEAALTV